jgi:hypothetical protein
VAEVRNVAEEPWPVSWEASRAAQQRQMAQAPAVQRLRWLEAALKLASASGALARLDTPDRRRRRGLCALDGSDSPRHGSG